jgi:hypothetical protein
MFKRLFPNLARAVEPWTSEEWLAAILGWAWGFIIFVGILSDLVNAVGHFD